MPAHFTEHAEDHAPDVWEADAPGEHSRILDALRLGFLLVETYRILRPRVEYRAKTFAKPKPEDARHRSRFDYTSHGRLNRSKAIILSAEHLFHLTETMRLDPPPMLSVTELREILSAGISKEAYADLHNALNVWSRETWIRLSTENEIAGRAFVYGGSLAYTYWLGYGERDAALVRDVVNPYRLERIAENFATIEEHLPEYVFDCLEYSLHRWRKIARRTKDDAGVLKWNQALGKQAGVWRDLLFGRRSPESFLDAREHRRIRYGALAISGSAIFLIVLCFWMGVWLVPRLGMHVIEGFDYTPALADQTTQAVTGTKLVDWFKIGSALLATLSSVSLFFAGLVRQVSGWVLDIHGVTRKFLTRYYVQRKTLRLP